MTPAEAAKWGADTRQSLLSQNPQAALDMVSKYTPSQLDALAGTGKPYNNNAQFSGLDSLKAAVALKDPTLLMNVLRTLNGANQVPAKQDPTNPAPPEQERSFMTAGIWRNQYEQQKAQMAGKQVAFLGDSVFANLGRDAAAWGAVSGSRPSLNAGIGGDRIQQMQARVQGGLFANGKPNVVVLNAGLNNAFDGDDPHAVAQGIVKTAQAIQSAAPGAKVLIMGPTGIPPRYPGDQAPAILAQINSALWAATGGGKLGPGIAFMSGTQALSGAPPGTNLLGPDNIHPNTLGNQILARNLRARIEAL